MKELRLFGVLVLLLAVTAGCSIANPLLGGNAGTVSDLWPDVPPMAGATKVKADIPVAAKLALRAMLSGQMDFIAYTTAKSAEDVKNFYTMDRMAAAGWDAGSSQGCANPLSAAGVTQLCIFERSDNSHKTGLAIIVVPDDQSKQTQLFYARFNLDETPTPG